MAFQDKSIQCVECGSSFTFTSEEQEFYQSKGFQNEPKRCPACRQARKSGQYGSNNRRVSRQMYPVVCAECGKETEVPFEPRGDRPVYCSDCFNKNRQRY